MTAAPPIIVWFRQDLRLADNAALDAAAKAKQPLLCVYVLDDVTPGDWGLGGASRWWLHQSLTSLAKSLAQRGARLLLRQGDAAKIIPELAKEVSASAIYWNRCYEPFAIQRDTALKDKLAKAGCEAKSFPGNLLFEPWTIRTKTGEPYKVYTPFWRACRERAVAPSPLPTPRKLNGYEGAVASDDLASWNLPPTKPDWAGGLRKAWKPGEAGAHAALAAFLASKADAYAAARDRMDQDGTSLLSPHLHWGEISPGQIWGAAQAAASVGSSGADKFLSEIGWREFAHHLLFHWPSIPEQNWRSAFDPFPWRADDAALKAWQRGRTGYPIVDAAMRQLWTTGWMHNRARMIAASFLIKHLLIDWREGQRWFWDTLVDADLANNAASWQWVAGCGADAAPYFRIFNPVTQGEKFDPAGLYVRTWIPELAKLPTNFIHQPWAAPELVLEGAGVRLGETYPAPIVDHAAARARALAAFQTLSSKPGGGP